jgi:voltage-gated potassium channel
LDYGGPLLKAFAGLAAALLFGTVGYRVVEGWSLFDAFYMTVITLTTIGFSEVHPLETKGRVLTLILIFMGVGLVAYAAITSTRFVIEGEVVKILTRRRSMKTLERIKDHFIVCGFGRMGSYICHQLHDRGLPIVVVEKDTTVQDRVMEHGYLLSPGEATEEDVLKAAGIARARGLFVALNSDAENVYTVLTARELNPALQIVARAGEESSYKKLLRAGADRVISPYQIGGMRLVMGMLKPTVMSFLEVVMDHKELEIDIEEVHLPSGCAYCGKRLAETDIRKELNLIVIAVKQKDGQMVFNPGPDTVVSGGDTLIAMGRKEDLEVLDREVKESSESCLSP